ncbi:tellurite resistance TerB family protein [Desulfosediminicola flagellatus]|uniref:tellurite resistance TerB family protein n=1 Tax=Desulfosediminicola flagellatus TaxID=2569541 RepID=UPI0010AC0694|nr:tellurite resistance TerB family protein [Desulfosediminicola flagellatus]
MAGFMDILGTVLQQGMSRSSGSRITKGLGGQSGADLNDLLGSIGSMMNQSSGSSSRSTSKKSGLGGVLGDVLGGLSNNKAALAGLGALAGAVLGGGKQTSRRSVGTGGLAMLASLAFAALSKAGKRPDHTPRALLETPTQHDTDNLEHDAEIIVQAMICAAKADGRIDSEEVQKIVGKMGEDGLTEDERQYFLTESQKPLDITPLISATQDDQELAMQVYAASLLAIDVDTQAERFYLQDLAKALNLPQEAVTHLENTLEIPGI